VESKMIARVEVVPWSIAMIAVGTENSSRAGWHGPGGSLVHQIETCD
jgi:hypothetical protein